MTPAHKLAVGALLGALVLVGLVVGALNHTGRKLAMAQQDAEAARLELQHQIVLRQETQGQLSADAEKLVQQNAELRDALAAAQQAAPGARTSGAVSLRTAPTKVPPPEPIGPAPLPECQRGEIYKPDGHGGFTCTQAVGASGSHPPTGKPAACVLSADDIASFKVDLLSLSTREGNALVLGTAELWRQAADLSDQRVLGPSRFQAALSQGEDRAPAAAPRWGAEVLGTCAARGCGLGAGVLFPPVGVFGARLEARAGAFLAPEPALTGGLGLRF